MIRSDDITLNSLAKEYIDLVDKAINDLMYTKFEYNKFDGGLLDVEEYLTTIDTRKCSELMSSIIFMFQILEYKGYDCFRFDKHDYYKLSSIVFRGILKSLTLEKTSQSKSTSKEMKGLLYLCTQVFKDNTNKDTEWKSLEKITTLDKTIALCCIMWQTKKNIHASILSGFIFRQFERFLNSY